MTCPRVKFQLNFRMLHPRHEVRTDNNPVKNKLWVEDNILIFRRDIKDKPPLPYSVENVVDCQMECQSSDDCAFFSYRAE